MSGPIICRFERLPLRNPPALPGDPLVAVDLDRVIEVVPVEGSYAIAVGERGGELDVRLVRIDG